MAVTDQWPNEESDGEQQTQTDRGVRVSNCHSTDSTSVNIAEQL